MADIELLASRARDKLATSNDKSKLRFLQITEQVVKGSGISHPPDVQRITRQVRNALSRRSAKKRTAEAARKRDRKALDQRRRIA